VPTKAIAISNLDAKKQKKDSRPSFNRYLAGANIENLTDTRLESSLDMLELSARLCSLHVLAS
jgi:hypothetical protein